MHARALVIRIGETPVTRKVATAIRHGSTRRRAPQQMDLFADVAKASDGKPSWPDLPERAQTALIELMTQLMRQHVLVISMREAGNDR